MRVLRNRGMAILPTPFVGLVVGGNGVVQPSTDGKHFEVFFGAPVKVTALSGTMVLPASGAHQ